MGDLKRTIAELKHQLQVSLAERDELLKQQAATTEVLQVINASSGDLEPVFDAILERAMRLCEAEFGLLATYEVGQIRTVAARGVPPAFAEFRKNNPPNYGPGTGPARILAGERVVHIVDLKSGDAYRTGDPNRRAVVDLGGARTVLLVPLLKNASILGYITIYRKEVQPYSDKQIDLLKNFADQAVIAIENARLFNETRETLERQTATAEILKVIASSPSDIQPVFDAIAESSNRLVGGLSAAVHSVVDDALHLMAFTRNSPEADATLQAAYPRALSAIPWGAKLLNGEIVETRDTNIEWLDLSGFRDVARKRGYRSMLRVPLLRDGATIGAINVTRTEPGKFSDHHIQLLQTFADQAVIAIENVRLFNEVQAKTRDLTESLDQQIATGEVLKAISHSAFELQPVFDAIAENSVKLCHAERAFIFRFDGQFLRAISSFNVGPEVKRFVDQNPIALGRHSISARAGIERRTVHEADVHADPEYAYAARDVDLIRTILAVPMLKSDELVGVITIYRLEVMPFTEKQVSLVETFAAQAVIAVENTRLINELRQSLDDLRAAQDRLVQTQKLASLGQLTAGIAHEIKNPLNFVNKFSGLSAELIGELQDVVRGLAIEPEAHANIKELTDMLSGNLEKIVQHGKRADAIVKSMLLHSGQTSGEHRLVDINALVDESLNRAYYGERAETRGFEIKLEKSFDPAVGEVDLFPREISRAVST